MIVNGKYLLSRIDELFDQLQGVQFSSKIDLRFKYYQLKIEYENSKPTFKTQYKY